MLVLGGVSTTDGPIGRFFPILEMVPPVAKITWDGDFPTVIGNAGEVETNGWFRVGGTGMEG